MVVLSRGTGLICTDIDRFTGLDLQWSWSNTDHKKEDEINVVLLDVIHQQRPDHDLLLKSVIQLS